VGLLDPALVPDRRHTLETSFKLLKPGGLFISSNVCLGGSWIPYGLTVSVTRWFGKAPDVQLYDRETIRRELREAVFVEIEETDGRHQLQAHQHGEHRNRRPITRAT